MKSSSKLHAWQEKFRHFAHAVANWMGNPWGFFLALLIIFAWALTGPLFHYSDTWQLIINTGTTIITFLMVFLIQNTQNRDAKAIHLKLDELIRAQHGARNQMMDLDRLSDEELEQLKKEFDRICRRTSKSSKELADKLP
jgi:low affinity Fe/Cu permease